MFWRKRFKEIDDQLDRLELMKTEQEEWEHRFVMFGYILLQALDEIAEITPGVLCGHNEIAREAREKFDSLVSKKGQYYKRRKKLMGAYGSLGVELE